MARRPDPKPVKRKHRNKPRRVEDPAAIMRKLLRDNECRVKGCGQPAGNGHHLVQRGSPHFGDDVEDNIVPVCGSGTSGHHGALHGSPFIDHRGKRWTQEATEHALGVELNQDEIRYVIQKLGVDPGAVYLARTYRVGRSPDGRLDSKTT